MAAVKMPETNKMSVFVYVCVFMCVLMWMHVSECESVLLACNLCMHACMNIHRVRQTDLYKYLCISIWFNNWANYFSMKGQRIGIVLWLKVPFSWTVPFHRQVPDRFSKSGRPASAWPRFNVVFGTHTSRYSHMKHCDNHKQDEITYLSNLDSANDLQNSTSKKYKSVNVSFNLIVYLLKRRLRVRWGARF